MLTQMETKAPKAEESKDKRDKYHPCHHGQIKIMRAHNSFFRAPRTSAASYLTEMIHSNVGRADPRLPCLGGGPMRKMLIKCNHLRPGRRRCSLTPFQQRADNRATPGPSRWIQSRSTGDLLTRSSDHLGLPLFLDK